MTRFGKFITTYLCVLALVILLLLQGCQSFDPAAIDEVVGLTPDEKGVLCVKASIVKGSSRLDYNRLEISNSENVASITAEQIQAACPK